MPRFYFDVADGDQAVIDADGRDLADEEAARRHAMVLAADNAKSHEALEAEEAVIVVTVRDMSHRTVATVSLITEVVRH